MSQIQRVKQMLPAMHEKGELGLPAHVPVSRFVSAVTSAMLTTRDLDQCSLESIIAGCRKAAIDGLLPDGREAALVVFKTKNGPVAQYMPMITGLLKSARNSGEILELSAHVVYERDEFHVDFGDSERLVHRPDLFGDRGAPRGAYAVGKTKDGGVYREFMTLSEIERVRSVSRSGQSGPWTDWWDRMAEKTVLRRLLKRMPMSSDVLDIVKRDEESDKASEVEVVDVGPARPAAGSLAEKLERARGGNPDEPPPDVDLPGFPDDAADA